MLLTKCPSVLNARVGTMSSLLKRMKRTRRVYNRSDIIIEAMLRSGLEELITNGFYEVDCMVDNSERVDCNYLSKLSLPNRLHNTAEESNALSKIMEELYQLEEKYKRKT